TFDSLQITRLDLVSPEPGATFVAPADISIVSRIQAESPFSGTVEFFANGEKIGEAPGNTGWMLWSGVAAGTYELTARLTNATGASLESAPITVEVTSGPGQSLFLGNDRATGGDWIGVYGTEGYLIAGHARALPAGVATAVENAEVLVLDDPSTDGHALQKTNGVERIASRWQADSQFRFLIETTDGQAHRVTVYLAALDAQPRLLEVRVLDQATRAVLDRRSIFVAGNPAHLRWSLRGRVELQIARLTGPNAVASGLFFDPDLNQAPVVNILQPISGAVYTLPAQVAIELVASDPDGQVTHAEVLADGEVLASFAQPPYQFIWTNPPPGSHLLMARAVDERGKSSLSPGTPLEVVLPPTRARFLGVEAATGGSWRSRYGSEGLSMPLDATNYFIPMRVSFAAADTALWTGMTDELRALERAFEPGRMAAAWYSPTDFNIRVGFDDDRLHLVSLYLLDWDSFTRRQRVDVVNPWTEELLSRVEFSDFHDGRYAQWLVEREVEFRIARLAGNAVVSGLFVDPSPVPYYDWVRGHWPSAWADDTVAGTTRDPDFDQFVNVVEYALGLNPGLAEAQAFSRVRWTGDRLEMSFRRLADASGVSVTLEVSEDLQFWRDVTEEVETVSVARDGRYELVTVRSVAGTPAARFFRLKVVADGAAVAP
ncbi:MAG TPA: Ig-like domain-containing protein, partial [Methylomirabilota bacterium]|nr:Ig-like domain-containing protein [Methylomirabilota bacterium]